MTKSTPINEIFDQYQKYRHALQMKPQAHGISGFVNWICRRHQNNPILLQEDVDEWFKKRDTESENTHYTRTVHLRHFLKFAIDHGLTDIIIPNIKSKGSYSMKSVVLMTEEEIVNFFKAIDEKPLCFTNKERYIMGITEQTIYRLLYSSGMRPNEARLLSVDDIDLETGVITIRETKGYNQHINVLCDSMLDLMKQYDEAVSDIIPKRRYFFHNPHSDEGYYTANWLGRRFSLSWHKYNNTDAVVYGFRHHYAIVNINSWSGLGFEVSMNKLLTLSRSMGHTKLKHTLYYYSLVPQYAEKLEELSAESLKKIIHKTIDYEEI